jgi:hypothetical protein
VARGLGVRAPPLLSPGARRTSRAQPAETAASTNAEPSRGANSLRRWLLLRADEVPEQERGVAATWATNEKSRRYAERGVLGLNLSRRLSTEFHELLDDVQERLRRVDLVSAAPP